MEFHSTGVEGSGRAGIVSLGGRLRLFAFGGFHGFAGLTELGITDDFIEVLLTEAARCRCKRGNPGVLCLQVRKEDGDRDGKVARKFIKILRRRLVFAGFPTRDRVGCNAERRRKCFLAQVPSQLANLVTDLFVKIWQGTLLIWDGSIPL